jgi:6,7-dimethyl-8-ribityllumazine synthase
MRTGERENPSPPDATGLRFAVIVSRFNDEITRALRRGAEQALAAGGASGAAVEVFDVPGAFELPVAARLAASSARFDAIVCLGCVIRGETPHFEYISSAVAHALAEVAVRTAVPVSFGVLTTDTIEQARARASEGPSNKGWEAAVAAIEMARLVPRLGRGSPPDDGVRV